MDRGCLLAWNGEKPEGIGVAQVVLAGEGEAPQVVERCDVARLEASQALSVERNPLLDVRKQRAQTLGLESPEPVPWDRLQLGLEDHRRILRHPPGGLLVLALALIRVLLRAAVFLLGSALLGLLLALLLLLGRALLALLGLLLALLLLLGRALLALLGLLLALLLLLGVAPLAVFLSLPLLLCLSIVVVRLPARRRLAGLRRLVRRLGRFGRLGRRTAAAGPSGGRAAAAGTVGVGVR